MYFTSPSGKDPAESVWKGEAVSHTPSDAQTWTHHHRCCILESSGVSGFAADTLVQATRPILISPRRHWSPVFSHSHLDASSAAPTLLLMALSLLRPVMPRWGNGLQSPGCPLPLACTSCDSPLPAPGAWPSSSLVPPPSPLPRPQSAPVGQAVLWKNLESDWPNPPSIKSKWTSQICYS